MTNRLMVGFKDKIPYVVSEAMKLLVLLRFTGYVDLH